MGSVYKFVIMKLKINMKKILLYSIPIAILALGYFIMSLLTSFQTETPRRTPEPVRKVVEAEVIRLDDVPTKILALRSWVSQSTTSRSRLLRDTLKVTIWLFLPEALISSHKRTKPKSQPNQYVR